ncbi:MAG TPA: hypothetical protein VI603_06350 [Saprospiraceae bacterium]|nr:hypothetical protein [Saprospiraceae bacterium]
MSSTNKPSIQLEVFLIKEGQYLASYCPALKLSGQGVDEKSAMESFDQVLKIFLDETTRKGTLTKVLRELGWILKPKSMPKPPRSSDIPSSPISRLKLSVVIPA